MPTGGLEKMRIALTLTFLLAASAVSADLFKVLEGDGSFLTSKIGPGQEILLVKVLQISNGPYSVTNTPSGIFAVSKVFLSSEGLQSGSTIRLYFCPEETDSIRTIRSWHGGDLYTDAEDEDCASKSVDSLSDVKLDHSTLHLGDELLVFCYSHLDDIGRKELVGALSTRYTGKIKSHSFVCFSQNAFQLGAVDFRKLEKECRLLRMKTILTKSLYFLLFGAPLLFFGWLRYKWFRSHPKVGVSVYCISWLAVCTMTLCIFNASDIGANLLLTGIGVAHAIYLCVILMKASTPSR